MKTVKNNKINDRLKSNTGVAFVSEFFNNIMILPTLKCSNNCSYCFGPNINSLTMSINTLKDIAKWIASINKSDKISITFHGGEPLLAGVDFYSKALLLLLEELSPRIVKFHIQSNLWYLTNELCEIFQKYSVSIGTSLDGPEDVNDHQRGKGYFKRTFEGIRLARSYGFNVGCICTITPYSAKRLDEIFNFFIREKLSFAFHPAVPSLMNPKEEWTLKVEEFSNVLFALFDMYLSNIEKIRISTIDSMVRSLSTGRSEICIFTNCLGHYLAIDPEGWIYPCQRFAVDKIYSLGNIYDFPTFDDLKLSYAWNLLKEREEKISIECGDCEFFKICYGGCPYNAFASGKNNFIKIKDPYCSAYYRFFTTVRERALSEVFSDENTFAIMNSKNLKYGIFQRGKVIQLLRGDNNQQAKIRAKARQILSSFLLAMYPSPEDVLNKLILFS